MRNVAPQQPQQQQNNLAIDSVRQLMQACRNAANPEAMLAQALQSNSNTSFIANALKNGTGLEQLAQEVAKMKGYNLDEVIAKLQAPFN